MQVQFFYGQTQKQAETFNNKFSNNSPKNCLILTMNQNLVGRTDKQSSITCLNTVSVVRALHFRKKMRVDKTGWFQHLHKNGLGDRWLHHSRTYFYLPVIQAGVSIQENSPIRPNLASHFQSSLLCFPIKSTVFRAFRCDQAIMSQFQNGECQFRQKTPNNCRVRFQVVF